ncbi:helix-turn-helix transcriptional regulator [Streptomyces sp. NPDC047072]|uniref:helix-turn-helix transcriptional regulator n=1 Tax=Streptomyces sp. NPDC047072 TaxID=3154809 RepID=UPI0033FE2BA0
MSSRTEELRAFLRSRRAQLLPADVGLPTFDGPRRVPGLRREELAQLSGISLDYYVRLEQGRNEKVSEAVLDALARTLRLDEVERRHLHNLARPRRSLRPSGDRMPGGMRELLDNLSNTPAFMVGRRTRVLAWNRSASAILFDFGAVPAHQRSLARLVFLDAAARRVYGDWQTMAREVTALLHLELGRHPEDRRLASLVSELSLSSSEFQRLWAEQHVSYSPHRTLLLRHPRLGSFSVTFRALRAPRTPTSCCSPTHPSRTSPCRGHFGRRRHCDGG